MKKEKSPNNKNQEENWEEKLTQFLLSEEILFKNEIGDGWIKISEGKQLTGEYQKIINKVAQLLKSEREKLLEKIKLEKFEILEGNKYKKGKEEGYFVQTNYALGYNQAVADLEKLKEAINDEK